MIKIENKTSSYEEHTKFVLDSVKKSQHFDKKNGVDDFFVSDDHYISPNSVLRGSLFGLVEKGTRKYEKNVVKQTLNGYVIKYTGEQLDQADFDVWLELLRRFSEDREEFLIFSFNSFLKNIKRNAGKKDYLWLSGVFTRLIACSVQINFGNVTYEGNLVRRVVRADANTDTIQGVELNRDLLVLFSGKDWTLINKDIRFSLKGKSLAQWLYSFYCTHKKPIPYSVEKIKLLCGSNSSDIHSFKQTLKKNLEYLIEETGWKYSIIGNKVYIEK